jgi:hypothetical protein
MKFDPVAMCMATYTDRQERAYAAAFGHWLIELNGDSDEAAREADDRAVGLRPGRTARIRRDVRAAYHGEK